MGWLVLVGLLLLPAPASAAERSVSDVVLVDAGTVIADDLYAAGNRVVILGRIDGDLVVSAFEDVTIAGTVRGDVVGVAGSVIVTGSVEGSVRVATPRLEIEGEVGGDVVSAAWSTLIAGDVDGDVVAWAWAARVGGVVGEDLEGQTRRMVLAGEVTGNVDITVGRLTVEPQARVGADLGYRSQHEAVGAEAAAVGGSVVRRLPLAPNIRVRAMLILAKVLIGLLAAVLGLLLMWAVPESSRKAAATVEASPLRSWATGLVVLLSPLLVVLLAVVVATLAPAEATLPLVAVFVPVIVAFLGMILALALASPTAAYPWLGRWRGRQRGPVRAFLLAALVVTGLALVPWMAWLVVAVVVPLGIGGWIGGETEETAKATADPAGS